MTFKFFNASRVALAAAIMFSLWTAICRAVEITSAQARTAVGNWLRRDAAPLGAKLGSAGPVAVTYMGAAGVSLFHVVPLQGGGFVVTSAEDGIEPIIAFSEKNNLLTNAANPLWALLNQDLAQRRSALTARRAALGGGSVSAPSNQPVQGSTEKEWADLLDTNQITALGLTSISDLRVAPVVASHWGQTTVSGFWGNYNCYNYYTPGAYPCGCVATAMAQIMRKHCYPTSSVTAHTVDCYVNGAKTPLTMIGGVYDWSNMNLLPDEGGDTAPSSTVRAAIGKLCYDAGVAVGMQYTATSSLASAFSVPGALVSVFGYASAYNRSYRGSEGDFRNTILVNLDHGYPVFLGISGSPGAMQWSLTATDLTAGFGTFI